MLVRAGTRSLEAVRRLFLPLDSDGLRVTDRGTSVEVVPTGSDTFAVTVYDQGDDAMIAAGRWHTHYEEPEQAAWGVYWLLTPFTRIVEELKGGVLVAVWTERYEAEGWIAADPVYYMNSEHPESWDLIGDERYHRRYTSQAVLGSPVPYGELSPGAELDADGLPLDHLMGQWVVEADRSQAIELG